MVLNIGLAMTHTTTVKVVFHAVAVGLQFHGYKKMASSMQPNKSLKRVQRYALHWTPSTGAATQRITGFGRRLALR